MAAAAAAVPAAVSGTQNDLEQPLDQLKAFADAAPDEIKDDLQTVAEGYAAFAQAIKDSGFDPSSGQPPSGQVIAAITAASQKLNTSDFRAAVNNVNTWFKEQCGQ